MKKTISEREYSEAKALYTLAAFKYVEVREYERRLGEIIGATDGDDYNESAADGIYGRDPGKAIPFDTVLKAAEITVRRPKKRKVRTS